MKTILLHTCCGPCFTSCAKRLLDENYSVTAYFLNDNIDTKTEFCKRLDNALSVCDYYGLKLIVNPYNHCNWLKYITGLEKEPEKGARCTKCFEYSLKKSAEYANAHGFDFFTTTLTVSPHKSSDLIFSIGKKINNFLEINFKKEDGFKKSIEISKKLNLYRQKYCGCEFAKAEAMLGKN
ncbi:MAG: epoxyqueuosine reductase QueH [Verrucomicrobiota bacterium]|nr:epoxyqueuosine reductase QueH [Verrucomicrobiota bacterium]